MYHLSKWTLDKQVLLDHHILNEYILHQRVYDLFPDKKNRCFQYCSNYSNGPKLTILIQSKEKPIAPSYGELETKTIDDSFFEHKKYLFYCKFCPVKQVAKSKKVIPLKKEEEVFEWLKTREESFGVCFNSESLMKSGDGTISMSQKNNPSRIHIDYVEVTGVFDVVDVNRFMKIIETGIGRSKGFGLGMVQIRPIE
ncbi:MAG: type I-E CRISPR-associated protein Cas6/Cse3/CasE [Candidatus Ornithospirochaeta sp.]